MDRTLYLGITDQTTSSTLKQLFADLEYIGHIKKYGNCCLFISTLVQRLLQTQGYKAEIRICNAIAEKTERRFLLGGRRFSKPGQLATHVICVLNESVLIDFGLGNIRRDFDTDFFQAVVLPYTPHLEILSATEFDTETKLYYIHDSMPDDYAEHQAAQESAVNAALRELSRYQANRFRYSLAKAFRNMGLRPRLPKVKTAISPLVTNKSFDDTHCG